MEINLRRLQRKYVLCCKGAFWQNTKSRSVTVIAQVKEPETSEVHCWRCGEVGHLESSPRNSRYQYQQHTKDKTSYQGQQTRTRETSTLKQTMKKLMGRVCWMMICLHFKLSLPKLLYYKNNQAKVSCSIGFRC